MTFLHQAIEGYYYEHNNNHEIMFTKKDNYWKLRKLDSEEEWIRFNVDNAIDLFNSRGLSLHVFEMTLKHAVLNKVCYYNMMTKKVEAMLGKAAVDRAIDDMDNFGKGLVKAIEGAFRKKNIRLVEKSPE